MQKFQKSVEPIPVSGIWLNLAEGHIDWCEQIIVSDFSHAERIIKNWQQLLPKEKGYFKMDFSVNWIDGKKYSGTMLLQSILLNSETLSEHIIENCRSQKRNPFIKEILSGKYAVS